jgi:hypothetical protein
MTVDQAIERYLDVVIAQALREQETEPPPIEPSDPED